MPEPGLRSAPDTILVGTVVGLVAIGLIMIFSASSTVAYVEHHDPTYYLKRQLLWLVVAVACALLVYRSDYRKLRKVAPLALAVACGMLVLVLVPHVGLISGGARRWLGGGPVSFQPSEFAKLALVVYLAAALSAKGEHVRSLPSGVVPLAAVTAVLTVLVLVEPDMGTASLLAFTAGAMLFAGGARRSHLLAIALVTLPPVIMLVLASPYKRARILAFLDPWKDPENTGFHIVQSLLALGSGGIFGLGLGMSRQKLFYLPEQFTDFIFAIIGEELGLLGAAVVIALFVVLAFRATRIALASPDRFGFFLCIGCMCLIVIQAFVNIGVVTSSWPVTGVPLPFISFGGSSLVVSLVAVALIVNIGRYRGLGRSEA
ncbi:MAG TPA: putative lipid II flippase FtsW [Candidatus Acidoferrales bacterium]|nr:putative lipid II flippase FtsW [Candidatus Acidoferrales bacterium]